MRHSILRCRLASSILLASLAAAATLSWAAEDIVVSDAKIAAGKLVISGTTAPNAWVQLDGRSETSFRAKSRADGTFKFSLAYHPGDCVVDLQRGLSPVKLGPATEALVSGCAPRPLTERGAWSTAKEYLAEDLVTANGASWRARRQSIGSEPRPGSLDWMQFANDIAGTGADNEGDEPAAAPDGPAGGDLAGTYPNPTIKANSVTTAKIADGSVTGADVANNSLTAADIATNAVGTAELADLAVTVGRLATNAVNSSKIVDGSITGIDVLDNSLGAVDIATNAVGTAELNDFAVTSGRLAPNAVTSDKIVDQGIARADLAPNAVASPQIADGSVTGADIDEASLNLNAFFAAGEGFGGCSADDHTLATCATASLTTERPGRILTIATGYWNTFSLNDISGVGSDTDDPTSARGTCQLFVDGVAASPSQVVGEHQQAGLEANHPFGGSMALTGISDVVAAGPHNVTVGCTELDGDLDWNGINLTAMLADDGG